MPLRMLLLLIALSAVQVNNLNAQLSRDSLIVRELLLQDLDSLENTILISHPAPFAFCGSEKFYNAFEEGRNDIDSVMSIRDFSRLMSKCIGVMEDSHSTMDYGQLVELSLSDKKDYVVPFSVYRKEREDGYDLLIGHDWQDALPRGGKLLSINGMDAHELYSIAMDYACIEGAAFSAQQSVASTLMTYINALYNEIDSVNVFEAIPYGSMAPEKFYLEGYHQKEFKEIRKKRSKLDRYKWIKSDFDKEHSLAVLTVGTFAPPSRGKFKRTVRKTFKTIHKKEYENLAIDLRGNGGGSSSWVEYLYSFIDSTGYNTPSNVIGRNSELAMSRSKGIKNPLTRALIWLFYRNDEDIQSFKHFRDLPLGAADTIYFKDKVIQKKNRVFNGNAYLLINGMSASASVDFTNAFQKYKRGTIVGEPCLGPQTGTWGNPVRYTLPNSGLRVTIATIRYNYDNTFVYMKNPIQPDYTVHLNPSDMQEEKDSQLDFVKSLIEKK